MCMRLTALFVLISLILTGCAQTQESITQPSEVPAREGSSTPDRSPSPSPTLTAIPLEDPYLEERQAMVVTGIIGWGVKDQQVVDVMGRVPRHLFVPDDYLNQAYANHPLPIGYGQTISQPYIVALMTQELGVEAGDKVLEIGTGSGYQAAVLAELGVEVFTMEIIGPLAEMADARLDALGYTHALVRHQDGYFGWPEEAPFDAIIVTAAPDHVPQPLLQQLKVGGVMVIPVGPVGGFQELWRITRIDEETVKSESLGGVRFVPLTRSFRDE
jgi:protein-L-isoaspartate(D-aspartate) O-methyltransferase